jgi:hypothetical protein
MSKDRVLCPICAWRGDCNKKYSQGEGLNCPDFSRDVTIKAIEEQPLKEAKKEEKKPKKGLWPI